MKRTTLFYFMFGLGAALADGFFRHGHTFLIEGIVFAAAMICAEIHKP